MTDLVCTYTNDGTYHIAGCDCDLIEGYDGKDPNPEGFDFKWVDLDAQ